MTEKKERKVWFITRPERDPVFHIDALKALQAATDNFEVVWARNREAHKRYEEELASQELKRDNISLDGSGGRTWAAMLKTFGYVYTNSSGQLRLTKVGKALLQGKVRKNITKQILTLQIPNAYFLESGFRPKFEEGFQIRPALFLIRLVNQKELDFFLTKEEITFFALTAKKDNDLKQVTENIIKFRNSTADQKEEMKINIASDHDHRERSDKAARDYAAAHGDVAHTFMMLCDYTGHVEYVRGDALRIPPDKQKEIGDKLSVVESRYPFNKRYLISLERFSENAGLDVDSYKASSYGSLGPATNKSKNLKKVKRLLAEYPSVKSLSKEEIKQVLEREFSSKEAEKFAVSLSETHFEALNEDFVESYLLEKEYRPFEDKTAEVLRAIGFEVELRPKIQGETTEIEILLHLDEENICIIDAKRYSPRFPLSAHLASHMAAEYIPNHNGYKGKSVSHFGYIVSEDWSGERNLEKISKKVKTILPDLEVKGAMITAKALLGFLDYCIDNDIDHSERLRLFMECFVNKGYHDVSEMI